MIETKEEKRLITLKEAAKLSGYSADYIGQLIRLGKIPGKQIYTNITWVTTAEAVINYKNNKQDGKDTSTKAIFCSGIRKIKIQLNVIRLFFQTFKSAIPLLAVLFFCFLVVGILLVQIFISNPEIKVHNASQPVNEQKLTF